MFTCCCSNSTPCGQTRDLTDKATTPCGQAPGLTGFSQTKQPLPVYRHKVSQHFTDKATTPLGWHRASQTKQAMSTQTNGTFVKSGVSYSGVMKSVSDVRCQVGSSNTRQRLRQVQTTRLLCTKHTSQGCKALQLGRGMSKESHAMVLNETSTCMRGCPEELLRPLCDCQGHESEPQSG